MNKHYIPKRTNYNIKSIYQDLTHQTTFSENRLSSTAMKTAKAYQKSYVQKKLPYHVFAKELKTILLSLDSNIDFPDNESEKYWKNLMFSVLKEMPDYSDSEIKLDKILYKLYFKNGNGYISLAYDPSLYDVNLLGEEWFTERKVLRYRNKALALFLLILWKKFAK